MRRWCCAALSVVIEANRPMATGLDILAEHYPTRWVRRRLAKVERDVRLGADWIDALWRAGVIRRSDAEVLASAASVGNLAWACRELADTADRRQQLRLQLIDPDALPPRRRPDGPGRRGSSAWLTSSRS